MRNYTVDQIRTLFLDFFRQKDHRILPSASLVPHGDPTLLLTVAGMVPFKRYFLGLEKPPYPRIATSQKCIRTADIDNVGRTGRHGTFFEMLGNFSFGDYFKEEIIPWAWEFSRDHLKFPEDRLWASVYEDDQEAYRIWRDKVGLPAKRLVRLGKADNFWETGSGPCGPCSELYFDRGPQFGCGEPQCQPGCDCERFLEFWNLVFIQDHQEGHEYIPLQQKGVDTGMGLERVAALLQDKESIFEIDNFFPVVEKVSQLAKTQYGSGSPTDVSLRVIADHLRAVAFLVSDGVLPTNEGRGYVLRRLIRRAVRHGRLLGLDGVFCNQVIEVVIARMEQAYPELSERKDYIFQVVSLEEERFGETLEQGMHLLEELAAKAKGENKTEIDGRDVFKLYDTFGFPIDLTREILSDAGLAVDQAGFDSAMESQRERARKSRGGQGYLDSSLEVYKDLSKSITVEFVGYAKQQAQARLLGIIVDGESKAQAEQGQEAVLILDQTPFYAEAGGQTSDHGWIEAETGRVKIGHVQQPLEGLIAHYGTVEQGFIRVGEKVEASIDQHRRLRTARHHTATHLLNWALREVLGKHVNQAGSYVGPERLRFDFTHFAAVSENELRQLEAMVNEEIMKNAAVLPDLTDLETAKKLGAAALFGEKYGEQVRMIQAGSGSLELCGGTHVDFTGEIGLFKIISEGSVAAGVRRIEAVAGQAALEYVAEQEKILRGLQNSLQSPVSELPAQIERLMEELRGMEREIASFKQKTALSALDKLAAGAEKIGEISLIVGEVAAADGEALRLLGDRLRDRLDPAAILLGARQQEKVLFLSMISKALLPKGLHAGQLVQQVARICEGGGGGSPQMAQAGGRAPQKLPAALQEGKKILREQIKGIDQ